MKLGLLFKTIGLPSIFILIGWYTDQPVLGCASAIILLSWRLLREKYQQQAVLDWIQRDLQRPLPRLNQAWEELVGLLYRSSKLHTRQQHTLTQALLSFRSAAQAMPDGVIALNSHDQIEWLNGAAEQQFALHSSRDLQQPLFNFVRQPEVAQLLREQQWGKSLQIKNHRSQTLAVQFVTFGAGQKLFLARDITPLEKLETMRRDFITNVSHELKTPLTVLAGFVETLQEHPDLSTSQQQQYLQLMHEQAQRMRRLVEDLLTLAALEAQTHAKVEEWIDIRTLIEKLHTEALMLSQNKHSIRVNIETAGFLCGNESEIQSALGNLVSNAIRYTPAGGKIEILWRIDEQGCGIFSVTDSGLGIQAQHLPRLTERFYRVDRAHSHETGGTGLGLAIVKHALTLHQAKLDIHSEYGHGSTFRAIFPALRIKLLNQ